MYIAQKIWDYKLKEIMSTLGLNQYGSANNAIYRMASELIENAELSLKIDSIIKRLES
jgi:hypothetical protein